MRERFSILNLTRTLLSAGLLAVAAVLTVQLILQSRENQELKNDLGEINHIRYGLLNADEWKERVTLILTKKIVEFDLKPENREELQESLEIIMYGLLDDLEKVIEQRTSGQFAEMKRWIAGMVLDVNQLRDSVPSYAGQVLDELNKPKTKQGIQNYLTDKLGNLSDATYNLDSMERMHTIVVKYACENKVRCQEMLTDDIARKTADINRKVVLVLGFVGLIFLLSLVPRVHLDRFQAPLLILGSACLLVAGISTPMIDLEARIDRLVFLLIGEEVVFTDNIIFFQTKSITDIVEILIREGSFEMVFVGILVFTFSIVFPFSKLLSSYLYSLHIGRLNENRLIRFFVVKSGKWSMADVMVVAFFMAYVGFDGIVGSQLNSLKGSTESVEIFTTNGTKLLGGFYLFLSFCISSLVLSEVMVRKGSFHRK